MAVLLNSLGNLSIDEDVNFYIFVIDGEWEEPLYKMVETNFARIAKNIGDHAVIARGLEPSEFTNDVSKAYLGENLRAYIDLLPAILVTNDHPEKISATTLRLFVPLATAEQRFGGWPNFFRLLADFVQNRNDEFLSRFQSKDDAYDVVNKIIKLSIGFGGVSININEFLARWKGRREQANRPSYT